MLSINLSDPALPEPPKRWSLPQRILGYIRRALNLGNVAGLLPNRKPGITSPKDPRS